MGYRKRSNQVYLLKLGHAHVPGTDGLSIDGPLEVEPSYRHDLELLGCLLLYFSGGYATCPNLIDISSAKLCLQFTAYFDYASGLCSDNKPDYFHLQKIFNDLFICQGFKKDNDFDWYRKKYQKLAEGKARAESRPLSQDWFPSQVKDIYARVLKAEQECMEAQTKLRAHVKPG